MSYKQNRIGYFVGPWFNKHPAQDGAVQAFREIESLFLRNKSSFLEFHPIDPILLIQSNRLEQLHNIDTFYCNFGPLSSLIMSYRETHGLNYSIIREIHTNSWIGCAFQESIASCLERPQDILVHSSRYSASVWKKKTINQLVYQNLLGSNFKPQYSAIPFKKKAYKVGFFSRFTTDKGAHFLPSIINILKSRGWNITDLHVAGIANPELLSLVTSKVENLQCQIYYHGPLSYPSVQTLMRSVDIILHPSVSSFESLGRVIIEACKLEKIVFASAYCGGYDILSPPYRIPLEKSRKTHGYCSEPFCIAPLALETWLPPRPEECIYPFNVSALIPYCGVEQLHKALLEPNSLSSHTLSQITFSPNISMSIDTPELDRESVLEKCATVKLNLRKRANTRKQLNDIGGPLKESILSSNFNPKVIFQT